MCFGTISNEYYFEILRNGAVGKLLLKFRNLVEAFEECLDVLREHPKFERHIICLSRFGGEVLSYLIVKAISRLLRTFGFRGGSLRARLHFFRVEASGILTEEV